MMYFVVFDPCSFLSKNKLKVYFKVWNERHEACEAEGVKQKAGLRMKSLKHQVGLNTLMTLIKRRIVH